MNSRELADRVFVASAAGYAVSWCLPAATSGALPTEDLNGIDALMFSFQPTLGLGAFFLLSYLRAGAILLNVVGGALLLCESHAAWASELLPQRRTLPRLVFLFVILSGLNGCILFLPRAGYLLWITSLLGLAYSFGLRRGVDLFGWLKRHLRPVDNASILHISAVETAEESSFKPLPRFIDVALVVLFIVCIAYAANSVGEDEPDVPRLQAIVNLKPARLPKLWGGLLLGMDGESRLLLRAKPNEEDGVFGPVARYQREGQRLVEVPPDVWNNQLSPSVDCRQIWQNENRKAIRSGSLEGKPWLMLRSGSGVKLFARHGLEARVSPSGRFVGVVSAQGPYWPSTPSIIGNSEHAYGAHYQEIVAVSNGEVLGEPLLLPFKTALERRRPIVQCWSPDERFIVYYEPLTLSVITIAPTGLPKLQASDAERPRQAL